MSNPIRGGGYAASWYANTGGTDPRNKQRDLDDKISKTANGAGITGGSNSSSGFEPRFGDPRLPGNPNAGLKYGDLPDWDPNEQQNPNVYDGHPGDKPNLESGNEGNPNAYNG